MDAVRQQVVKKMESMQELFEMETDDMIKIAKHFKWNEEKMQQEWFTNMDRLKFKLGIKFDDRLNQKYPHIRATA